MKRFFMFFMACIATLSTCLCGLFAERQNSEAIWNDLGYGPNSIKLYIYPDEAIFVYSAYNYLESLSDQYHVNLYKTDILEENNSTVLTKSVYCTFKSPYFIPPLSGNEKFSMDKLVGHKISVVLETNNLQTPEGFQRINHLYSFLKTQSLRIQPLYRFCDRKKTISGVYYAEFQDTNLESAFLKDLAQGFDTTVKDLTSARTVVLDERSFGFQASASAAVISGLLFILLTVFYLTQRFKSVGCGKLMGYSNLQTWGSIFVPVFFAQLLTAASCVIILRTVTNIPQGSLLKLATVSFVSVGVTAIVSICFIRLIHSYKISDLVKSRQPTKSVVACNCIVKGIVMTVVCALVLDSTNMVINLGEQYETVRQWDRYGDQYAIMDTKVTKEDESDLRQGTYKMATRYAKFYNEANRLGAVYVSSGEFDPFLSWHNLSDFDVKRVPQNFYAFMIAVNPNYLKDFPVKDDKGRLISISEEESSAVFLVPDIYKSRSEDINYLLRYGRRRNISIRINIDKSTGSESPEIKVIYYPSGKKIFSFNTEIGKENGYQIENPIYRVLTEKNMTFLDKKDILAHGCSVNGILKYPIKGKSAEEVYKNFKPKIKEFGLEKNIARFTSIKAAFESQILTIKTLFKINIAILISLFILAIWISLQSVKIFFSSGKKIIAVKRSLGYRFFDTYRGVLRINTYLWIVQICVSLYLYFSSKSSDSLHGTAVFGLIPFLVLDFLFLIVAIRGYENRNLSTFLKEGLA